MSQIIKTLTSGGPIPPIIPTSFVTQDGTAVPAANILIVNGFDSAENNINGIITKGGVAGTGTANEVDVIITNRVQGQVTTSDATPTNIITFPAGATPGNYIIDGTVNAYDITDTAGAAYFFTAGIRTTGAATVLIGSQFSTEFEEAAMVPSDIDVVVSGNNIIVQVVGIVGKTIDWDAIFTYRFVS